MTGTGNETKPSQPADRAASPLAKYAEHWLLPNAEIRYADSRERRLYRHYDKEQTVVGQWLRLCNPGAVVLDLPCGTGRFSELVAQCGHRLIRADLSCQMVAHARRIGPNHHVLGDLCSDLAAPPLAPGSVDVVLVWRLFHHCRTPGDREAVLRQAQRLARQYVIISYYNRASITFWAKRIVRNIARREPKARGAIWTSQLMALANKVGLSTLHVYHYARGISINSAACFSVRRQPGA